MTDHTRAKIKQIMNKALVYAARDGMSFVSVNVEGAEISMEAIPFDDVRKLMAEIEKTEQERRGGGA